MHSDASKVTSNPGRCHYGWHHAGKLSKSVTLDALKNTLPGPACFFCKTFSSLFKFILGDTSFCGSFFKNSYIQIKNLYGYILRRAAK